MRHVALLGALAACAAAASVTPAHAQGLYGYVFGAPGRVQCCGDGEGTFQVGAGAEVVAPVGVGVGAEIGFLGPTDGFGDGLGVFSLNGSYHFGPHRARLRPFVTSGYSLFFREGRDHLWNVGGGVQYWFTPRLALRVEVRDHVHTGSRDAIHFWGVRAGVSFGRGRG